MSRWWYLSKLGAIFWSLSLSHTSYRFLSLSSSSLPFFFTYLNISFYSISSLTRSGSGSCIWGVVVIAEAPLPIKLFIALYTASIMGDIKNHWSCQEGIAINVKNIKFWKKRLLLQISVAANVCNFFLRIIFFYFNLTPITTFMYGPRRAIPARLINLLNFYYYYGMSTVPYHEVLKWIYPHICHNNVENFEAGRKNIQFIYIYIYL